MKGRGAQVSRIIMISRWLSEAPHGLTAQEIRERLAALGERTSIRTIYRDLQALQRSGLPVQERDTDQATQAVRWSLTDREAPRWQGRDREATLLIYHLVTKGIQVSNVQFLNSVLTDCLYGLDATLGLRDREYLNDLSRFIETRNRIQPLTQNEYSQVCRILFYLFEEEILPNDFSVVLKLDSKIKLKVLRIVLSERPHVMIRDQQGGQYLLDFAQLPNDSGLAVANDEVPAA